MTITARFPGTCRSCHRAIGVGEKIEWTSGSRPSHTKCPADRTPVISDHAAPSIYTPRYSPKLGSACCSRCGGPLSYGGPVCDDCSE